jgi:hypothetical protein
MKIDISHQDITSELCQTCAACCRVSLRIAGTNSRYRMFLRKLGYTVLPPPGEDKADCCEKEHEITLDMGYCKHLVTTEENGDAVYRCKIYGTSEFPDLCADFDCVSWAKHADRYVESNKTLRSGQAALNLLRTRCAAEAELG